MGEREIANKYTSPNSTVLEFGGGEGLAQLVVLGGEPLLDEAVHLCTVRKEGSQERYINGGKGGAGCW